MTPLIPIDKKKLIKIKLIHTIIWVFYVIVIFYILYCGITNTTNVYTWFGLF